MFRGKRRVSSAILYSDFLTICLRFCPDLPSSEFDAIKEDFFAPEMLKEFISTAKTLEIKSKKNEQLKKNKLFLLHHYFNQIQLDFDVHHSHPLTVMIGVINENSKTIFFDVNTIDKLQKLFAVILQPIMDDLRNKRAWQGIVDIKHSIKVQALFVKEVMKSYLFRMISAWKECAIRRDESKNTAKSFALLLCAVADSLDENQYDAESISFQWQDPHALNEMLIKKILDVISNESSKVEVVSDRNALCLIYENILSLFSHEFKQKTFVWKGLQDALQKIGLELKSEMGESQRHLHGAIEQIVNALNYQDQLLSIVCTVCGKNDFDERQQALISAVASIEERITTCLTVITKLEEIEIEREREEKAREILLKSKSDSEVPLQRAQHSKSRPINVPRLPLEELTRKNFFEKSSPENLSPAFKSTSLPTFSSFFTPRGFTRRVCRFDSQQSTSHATHDMRYYLNNVNSVLAVFNASSVAPHKTAAPPLP